MTQIPNQAVTGAVPNHFIVALPPNVRQYLDAKTNPADIRQDAMVPGSNFRPKYTAPAATIRQLNEAFGHAWSMTFTPPQMSPCGTELITSVKLTVYVKTSASDACVAIEKMGLGQCRIRIATTGTGPQDWAYDAKAAITDGIRKAATLFGIGLDHYEKDEAPFQGLQTAPTVEKATSIEINNLINLFESGNYGPPFPRTHWMKNIGVTSESEITRPLARAVMDGTHPYMVMLRGGAIVPMHPPVTGTNA